MVGASTSSNLFAYDLSGSSNFTFVTQPNSVVKGCAVSGKGRIVVAVGERKGSSGFTAIGATTWKLTLCQATIPGSTTSEFGANEHGQGQGGDIAPREVKDDLLAYRMGAHIDVRPFSMVAQIDVRLTPCIRLRDKHLRSFAPFTEKQVPKPHSFFVDCAVPSSLDLICRAFWQVMAAISALSSKVDAGFNQIFGILTDHSRRLDKLQESVQISRQ